MHPTSPPAAGAALTALMLAGFGALLSTAAPDARAQATVREDGQWRAAVGISFSHAGGNTRGSTFSSLADAVKATPQDKWALYANALYGTSAGNKTADQWRAGTKYDWNLSERLYSFGTAEVERDRIAGLDWRGTVGAGAGYRFVKSETDNFEVFAGAAWIEERYEPAREIEGVLRAGDAYPSLLLGEESSHRLGESTTAKQRLVVTPNLDNEGQYRAQWDAGIAVAVAPKLNLTVGFAVKYNSDPGGAVRRTDTLFTTGLGLKFE